LALALPLAATAFAQDATTAEDDEEDTADQTATLDTVTVVGSRIKRSEIEGPSPVVVVSREDFARAGFRTVGDALQTLTQNTTASFTGDLAVTGFTPNAQVVNLRGLGPGYTLTLINGRRPAQYPQPYNRDNNIVNIRAIPSSIIERIEILTGGASAIYGSDAISGVVNVVLRENFDGNTARLQVGTTEEGGGDSFVAEITGGRTGDRWSAVWALQASYDEPVFASQRDILADTRNGPLGSITNPSLALAALRFNPANSGIGASVYYPGQAVCDQYDYTTVTTAARGQYCGGFTQPASRSISNKDESYAGYGQVTFDLTDNLQVFGAANVYQSNASSSSGTEFWSTSNDPFMRTATGGQINGYFDSGFNAFTFLQRVFNPFELGGPEAATTLFDELTYDVSAGISGTFGERFDWEASAAYSKYDYTADRPRLLAQAMHDYFLGPQLGFRAAPNGVLLPIYDLNEARWNAPFTPAQYAAVSTRAVNEGEATSKTVNFVISGDLFELPAGPVGFAGVMEWGQQGTELNSDPRTLPSRPRDSQTIYNLNSSGRTVGERDRYAVGTEFRVPLLDSLSMNIAGRYDKYSDITEVDDAVTTMAGLEWRPFDNLLLRASYATSFRAPDLQLVYAEGAGSFAGILDQYACRAGVGVGAALGPRTLPACNVVGDPTIYTAGTSISGNPLLKEEEGETTGIGFVWDITEGMAFSLDYYRIKLEDQATSLTSGFLLANEANCRLGVRPDGTTFPNAPDSAFCQNVFGLVQRQGDTPDGSILRINSAYINAANIDTSGLDATFTYVLDTDRWGTFSTNLGWSLVLTDKFRQFDTDVLVDFRDDADLDSRSRARGSLTWEKGDWSTTVFGTRIGSNGSNAGADGVNLAGGEFSRRLAPWMQYNLQVGKRFSESTRATFSVINVLNDQYREDNSFTGYPYFQAFIGADPLGRRYNLSIQHNF
ncbi:MAG: TonB-dependent receptor, partial [Arenimonas sp.]|uniref:TonB-dependent receptor domain-containing protein n=1 Tax=Arenimonas sp. TaxID=1872635 RepID=UPI0025C69CA5